MTAEAWTYLALNPEREEDWILPRYDSIAQAREMAKAAAKRTGRAQLLCKIVEVEYYRGSTRETPE